ncbi:MAG TPA: serine hydrolase domain-containing protein [Gaiellaceae bacterium]|jgi:D-alanyl-D-alanine carboxypeptidase
MTRSHHLTRGAALAVALLTAAVTSATLAASGAAKRPPTLRQQLAQLVAAGAPGAIVLTRDGDRTVRISSGLADVGTKAPMRANDRFRIASLTKSFVATVVLQLVGERKLTLDASVERFLPGLVPDGARITIRELLNHTSGLFDYENDPRVLKPYLSGNLGYHWPPRALVEMAVSHKPLFAPGSRYSYSNTNYILAGLIVEAISGRPLSGELRRRIFEPLQLRSTSFPTAPGIAAPYAHGYYLLGTPPATDVSGLSPFPWAAGAIVSTVADLATFYRALLSGRLLGPGLLRAMETTVPEGRGQSDMPGERSGLGLQLFPTRCGVAYGHNGTFPGYLVYAFTSKDGRRQSVLMVNKDAGSLPKPFAPLYFRLLANAYCQTP